MRVDAKRFTMQTELHQPFTRTRRRRIAEIAAEQASPRRGVAKTLATGMDQRDQAKEQMMTRFPRPSMIAAIGALAVAQSVALGAPSTLAARPLHYTYTDLGTLPGGTLSYAYGINTSGQVAGFADTSSGADHAFLWTPATKRSPATMTDLGTLSGGDASVGGGVNDSAEVVGFSDTTATGTPHAVLYSGGNISDLGTLPGGTYSQGAGINGSGQMVGIGNTSSASQHAFLWTPATANGTTGTMTDLGTMNGGTYSEADSINSTGQITGDADTSNGNEHAFMYPAPNGCSTPVSSTNGSGSGTFCDLGTLSGGTYSAGDGLNDSGEVVGQADDASGNAVPFLFSGGAMYDLGSFGGTRGAALAINTAGQVVGHSDTANDATEHAFIWTPASANGTTGAFIDLNSVTKLPRGVTLAVAEAINANGWIAGWSLSTASPGTPHAFLLQP